MSRRACLDAALACAMVAGAILLFVALANAGIRP